MHNTSALVFFLLWEEYLQRGEDCNVTHQHNEHSPLYIHCNICNAFVCQNCNIEQLNFDRHVYNTGYTPLMVLCVLFQLVQHIV